MVLRPVTIFTGLAVFLCHILGQATAAVPEVEIDSAVVMSPHEMRVSWEVPDRGGKRGKARLRYNLRYRPKGGKYMSKLINRPEVILSGLTPNTTYMVAVRVQKGAKLSDWSKSVERTTLSVAGSAEGRSEVLIREIGASSVRIAWRLADDTITKKDIRWFVVAWRRDQGGDLHTSEVKKNRYTVTNLEPGTTYQLTVSVIMRKAGNRTLQTLTFTTIPFVLPAPSNLKFTKVNSTFLAVKWRHVKAPNEESSITSYLVEYMRVNARPTEVCQVEVNGTARALKIKGLLPDQRYMVRVAGKSGETTGLFADWFVEKTLPIDNFEQDMSEFGLRGMVISPTELLLYWKKKFPDGRIYLERGHEGEFVQNIEIPSHDGSYHFFRNLEPDSTYKIALKQFPPLGTCPETSYIELKTYSEAMSNSSAIATENHNSDLRLLQIPDRSQVIVWEPAIGPEIFYLLKVENTNDDSVVTHYTSRGNNSYMTLNYLDSMMNYTISLRMYDGGHPQLVYPVDKLFIQGLSTDEAPSSDWDHLAFSVVSSTEMFVDRAIFTDSEDVSFTFNGDSLYRHHKLQAKDWDLLIVDDPGSTFNITAANSTDVVETLIIHLTSPEIPDIVELDDVTFYEGDTMKVTCRSQADPLPVLTWVNVTTEDAHWSRDENITTKHYRIAKRTPTGVVMVSESVLEISNLSLNDSGVFACIASNSVGNTTEVFNLIVIVRPPGPVMGLTGAAVTPYEIRMEWTQPVLYSDGILGYNVQVEDEYGFILEQMNTAERFHTKTGLLPNRTYTVMVRAVTNKTSGEPTISVIRTRPLPVLDPPKNVTITTMNGSVIRVGWQVPYSVRIRYLYLRAYLINYRRNGATFASEFTVEPDDRTADITGLVPNQLYDIRVIALSEDGQAAYSDWKEGSTMREQYMDETIPPQPPSDVYLRAESGNILVTWLPPYPGDNVLIRSFSINVVANGTLRESLEVKHVESSIIVYDTEPGVMYRISVRTNNKAGASREEWAEILIPQEEVTRNPVENFRGYGLSSTKLQLHWDRPIEGSYSHFLLTYSIAGNQLPGYSGGGNLPANAQDYVVRSLQPYTEYYFQITPFLNRKKGKPANVTVMTLSDKPTNPPSNISVTSVNATSVTVRCVPPLQGKNGRVISYKVAYRVRGSLRFTVTAPADENESLNCILTDMTPSTVYEFRIKAMTVNGSGPWSEWLPLRTPDPVPVYPSIPKNMKTEVTSKTILVSWELPEADMEHVDGFIVGYGKYLPEVRRVVVTREVFQVLLSGLESDTLYIVSVRSFNEYGESEAAFNISTTDKGVEDATLVGA